jgi:hypothetical protein
MFIELQCAYFILKKWKRNRTTTKKQIGLRLDWMHEIDANQLPLSDAEVATMKDFLRRKAPTSYFHLFPEDKRPATTVS